MAKKVFDIMPPYPKRESNYHRESPKKKEKRKSKSLFFSILLISFIIILSYVFINAENPNQVNKSSSSANSQFELFGNDGESSFTKSANPIVVRITDGSSDTIRAISIRDTLLSSGFQIEKLDKAGTDYAQTVIYYKTDTKAQAQKASDAIASIVSPNLQESPNLEKSYDILIIVGNK